MGSVNVKPDFGLAGLVTFTGPPRLMSCQSVKQVRLVSPVVSPFSLFTLVAEPLQAAV